MKQLRQERVVAPEQTFKRLTSIEFVLFSVLLAIPLIGLVFGFFLAMKVVIFVTVRSKSIARDLTIGAATIAAGFLGMTMEIVCMSSGHVAVAVVADAALNYFILTVAIHRHLGHVFSRQELQVGR